MSETKPVLPCLQASTQSPKEAKGSPRTDRAAQPLVSIVIPALNEEITIARFIEWCQQGLKAAGIEGEILIIDSSTDKTPDIAASLGARVLKVPKRGLGQAYKDAIPSIRGKYVIMGDCDCTYDFRSIKPFIEKLDQGYEYVMGSRFRGTIEKNAMPFMHQYFGTPVTTFILNAIYRTRYSDIHCGMRAMTLDALKRMNLESASWEYASEMVIKATKLGLKIAEVPINFFKEPEGRLSHFKRRGWTESWKAGWINLKVMFLYAPDFLLLKPGLLMLAVGVLTNFLLINGPIYIFSNFFMLLGLTLAVLGYSFIQLGVLSKVFYNFNPKETEFYSRLFAYNRSFFGGTLFLLLGLAFGASFVYSYAASGKVMSPYSHHAVFGLMLIILGLQTISSAIMVHMIVRRHKP